MKKFILPLAAVLFVLVSCIKENTPANPLNDTVDPATASTQSMGDFVNGPYGRVSGMAAIYKQHDSLLLALRNVSISNGPDLHVYISKEVLPVNFIDLGSLQSTNGNQLYLIPGNPDLLQYKYALIHCKQYNHLFGSAELR